MKKKTLVALIGAQLFAAGSALAWQPADDFNGPIQLGGDIIKDMPMWQFQIPETTRTTAEAMAAKQSEGSIDGSTWSKEFITDMTYLQGRMTAAATDHSKLLLPTVVTTGSDGVEVRLDPQAEDHRIVLKATGNKTGVTDIEGQLALNIKVGSATAGKRNAGADAFWTCSGIGNSNNPDAIALMRSTDAFQTHYGSLSDGDNKGFCEGNHQDSENVIAWLAAGVDGVETFENIVAVYNSKIATATLNFPASAIPENWTAQLPVTITLN